MYLEGRAFRAEQLIRAARGPRPVRNAPNRIVDSYEGRTAGTRQELDLARSRLTDYEARLGRPSRHGK